VLSVGLGASMCPDGTELLIGPLFLSPRQPDP
jgi:hypothetical protein